MTNPFLDKLLFGNDFSTAECTALVQLVSNKYRIHAHKIVVCEGTPSKMLHVMLDGVACRYKTLRNGKRQITAFLLPGDMCDYQGDVLDKFDHSIETLTDCWIGRVSHKKAAELAASSPRIERAFRWSTMVEAAISREWITSIGQRSAERRLTHLFSEWLARLQIAGQADATSCALPIIQADLGEALGLSSVHVNRSLQMIREAGLVLLKKRVLSVPDIQRLHDFSDFTPTYLHPKSAVSREPRQARPEMDGWVQPETTCAATM